MLKTIPLTPLPSWQESLSDLVTDPEELLSLLGLDDQTHLINVQVLKDFPLRVPRPYLSRIEPGNINDPLLRQIFPDLSESDQYEGFSPDPLAERNANPIAGVLHKYQGRALLIPTSTCAIHCRYCFRRHFPYADNKVSKNQWQENLQYIADDSSISEVILSGGDPLALSDKHLGWLLEELNAIDHITTLRIHTRLPIMIPQRVSSSLCNLLARQRLKTVLVLHSNHAQEFDHAVDAACARLKESGITLLNQSVLLKGVNDSGPVLISLSKRLFQAGVLPYYLHLLDRVDGAGHFQVKREQAFILMREIQQQLPGYLLPRLAEETPGLPSKTLIHF